MDEKINGIITNWKDRRKISKSCTWNTVSLDIRLRESRRHGMHMRYKFWSDRKISRKGKEKRRMFF